MPAETDTPLDQEKCMACRPGAPRVEGDELHGLMAQLPGWEMIEADGIARLTRLYPRENFLAALDLANAVGAIAEAEDHHPEIVVEWGKLRVSWWTHTVNGLHRNDFIMAAKTDALAAS